MNTIWIARLAAVALVLSPLGAWAQENAADKAAATARDRLETLNREEARREARTAALDETLLRLGRERDEARGAVAALASPDAASAGGLATLKTDLANARIAADRQRIYLSAFVQPELAQEALGPDSDPQNPLLREVGWNYLKGRLRSHPDVAERYYQDVFRERAEQLIV